MIMCSLFVDSLILILMLISGGIRGVLWILVLY